MKTPTLLCGRTAFAYWHSLRTYGPARLGEMSVVARSSRLHGIHPARMGTAPRIGPSDEGVRAICKEYGIAKPLDILVSNPAGRHRCHAKRYFVWSQQPPSGSVVRIGDGVFVCTPEFLALQYATALGFVPLLVMLYELAGTYALAHWGCESQTHCRPLLSSSILRAFLDRSAGCAGIKTALKAASFLLEGSGSPMETAVAILLCLPRRYGGYGLTSPLLNKRVTISSQASSTGSEHDLFCDLYWPASKTALEYDGLAYHAGAEHTHRDYVRANELQAAGISIDVLTHREVLDPRLFDTMARRIARKIGFRLRSEAFTTAWRSKHQALRNELLSSSPREDLIKRHPLLEGFWEQESEC